MSTIFFSQPLSGVRQTAAMVKQMNNGQVLVGYIAANEAIEEFLLKDFLSRKIAPYMIPQKFVFMDALPLTPTGKVDRKLLPTPAFSAEDIVAPRNEAERALAALWAEVLGIDYHNVSVEANFFEMGGDSLLAIKLVSLIRRSYSDAVSVANVLLTPTIASFVQAVPHHSDADHLAGGGSSSSTTPSSSRPRTPSSKTGSDKNRTYSLLNSPARKGRTNRSISNKADDPRSTSVTTITSKPGGSLHGAHSPGGSIGSNNVSPNTSISSPRNRSSSFTQRPTIFQQPPVPLLPIPKQQHPPQNSPKKSPHNTPQDSPRSLTPHDEPQITTSASPRVGHTAFLTPPSPVEDEVIDKKKKRKSKNVNKKEQSDMMMSHIRRLNSQTPSKASGNDVDGFGVHVSSLGKRIARFLFQILGIIILVQPVAYGFIGAYMLLFYLSDLGNFNLAWIVPFVYHFVLKIYLD